MKLEGSYIINASKEEVWLAMNNPEILQASIPGCESLEKLSETQFTAIVKAKIGPVKASFTGEVSLENLNPPHSYTLTGEGKGGLAGFASGAADITLSEHDEGTELQYEVEAQVGGKIAQIGSRLVGGAAKKLSDQFFRRFAAAINGEEENPE